MGDGTIRSVRRRLHRGSLGTEDYKRWNTLGKGNYVPLGSLNEDYLSHAVSTTRTLKVLLQCSLY